MEELSKIDERIFWGTDLAHNELDKVYRLLKDRIENLVDNEFFGDRSGVRQFDMLIAIVWRLSVYYSNTVVEIEDILRWERAALEFFDNETKKRADGDKVQWWQNNIAENCSRLRDVLVK